ncbi:DNA translocase FtsK [Halomonas sp. YLB-10]|nr:DNA translocase FtsK [Halomonas sp. YLB-10]
MVKQALYYSESPSPKGSELLRERLVEILRELKKAGITVPVRKFAGFVLAAASESVSGADVYSPEEMNALVGRCLVHLDMFPDEEWRHNPGNISRRLSLNLWRSELAASPSSDLDTEKVAQECLQRKFVDESGVQYQNKTQAFWRKSCSDYCLSPTRKKREKIPYRIFEQVFNKDVKGLPLGKIVAEEISENASGRKLEFDELNVEAGLNNRSSDEARRFLESEPTNFSEIRLKDLLSKATLKRVEKLASPVIERIQNPLIKLAQVAMSFRERIDLDENDFSIKLRVGVSEHDQYAPTLGLFAFLYGRSLVEVCSSLADGLGALSLKVDERLTTQSPPPLLKKEIGPELERANSESSEENEGTYWPPIPLDFVLVKANSDEEIDSESAYEWLPEDLPYLVMFWISVCGEDRCDIASELHAPSSLAGEAWIKEVMHRLRPLDNGMARPIEEYILKNPVMDRLVELRTRFRSQAEKDGISSGLANDVFDSWATLLSDARKSYVPDGDIPHGMIEFLHADCIKDFDGDSLLMLQSHPLKLRWISAYLNKSAQLACDAMEGNLKLNSYNELLYLDWIQGLSPYQQPTIHTVSEGDILFAAGERGWTEKFERAALAGGTASADGIHLSLVGEIIRQITSYLYAHPYKADGLTILVVTSGASSLPADIVQGVRRGEFKHLKMTIELVAPKDCWDEAARQFELVDTDNRLAGEGALFPPVQLNMHALEEVKKNADAALGEMVCDLAIVPQLLDENVSSDAKTESEATSMGKFNPLLDDPTYIASGAGSSALWVSLRPKMPDCSLSDWSTLVVRHERRNPVAADRPEATDFIDIRINFHNTARFFGALHKRSHWVVIVERHITREQIEKLETRPEVLSLRDGVGPGGLFTLIVSSNTGKKFVIDRLTRKLKRIAMLIGRDEMAEFQACQLAKRIYEETRQISPRLTLDALGISRVTEEILGLSVARQIADLKFPVSINEGFVAWISLDEHPEFFASANSMRADMIRLSASLGDDGLSVELLVLESKLRRLGYDAHGAEQVRRTLEMFDAILPQDSKLDPMDGELWRETILSAVDTISEEAVFIPPEGKNAQSLYRSRVSEDIRSRFREGKFFSVKIAGLYSICEYSHPRDIVEEKYEADSRVTIVQTGGSALLKKAADPHDLKLWSDQSYSNFRGNEENSLLNSPKVDNAECFLVDVRTSPRPLDQEYSLQAELGAEQNENGKEEIYIGDSRGLLGKAELDHRYQIILDTFGQYGINVSKTAPGVEHAIEGPASILYRVRPGKGVPPSKLSAQHDALKLALELEAVQDIRFDIDKGYVTIDVPKLDEDRYFVSTSQLWFHWKRPDFGLRVPLGEDRFGNVVEIDFTSSNSPHLLIGGTTGSGKSEALNTILAGITEHYLPTEVRLHLIDPKGTELDHLSQSKHLEGEIGWDEEDAIDILSRAVEEMQLRYSKFKSVKVRTLEDYNDQASESEKAPRWVIVLDEYADLTSEPESKKTIEGHLKRLAQKARAAGIHVIIATQKPDASVISTNLRSNLPSQLALRVKSSTESRVIMDDPGAEALTGKGDAFFKESGVLTRIQCAKIG